MIHTASRLLIGMSIDNNGEIQFEEEISGKIFQIIMNNQQLIDTLITANTKQQQQQVNSNEKIENGIENPNFYKNIEVALLDHVLGSIMGN
jgi:predicted flavoprotein YhiN